jgi:hypothetical protein
MKSADPGSNLSPVKGQCQGRAADASGVYVRAFTTSLNVSAASTVANVGAGVSTQRRRKLDAPAEAPTPGGYTRCGFERATASRSRKKENPCGTFFVPMELTGALRSSPGKRKARASTTRQHPRCNSLV